MSKRIFSLIALIMVASLLLAACQPAGSTPETTEEPMTTETEAPATGGQPEVCASDRFGCAVIPAGSTIKIGMGAPMTGDNAAFGTDISQAARIAVQDAGDISGFAFELVAEDDQGAPEGGAAVANKLASDPQVVAVAGHIFSGATNAAIPIYEAKGIPMMSPSATLPELTQIGSKVFNRLVFTDAAQGRFAAEYMFTNLSFTKIAVLHDGSPYGQGLAEVVRDEFAALGGEVVNFQGVTSGEPNYDSVLADISSLSPQAIYFGGYTGDGVVLVNGMKTQGLENATFFGADGIWGVDFLERTGANGVGTYAASLVPPVTPTRTEFDDKYLAAYGIEAGKLSAYTYTGYDAAAVLTVAVKQVAVLGDDGSLYIPRGALVDAVRGIKDYSGLSGSVSCDEVGECSSSGPTFYVIEGDQWVVAP